jgi:tetraacyldisaccharide 4'-kinase
MTSAPAHWESRSWKALALAPVGAVYGRVTLARMARAAKVKPAPVPILCVGNLVAGGAGKTPTAIAVAKALSGMGRKPAFLSRGYGGGLLGPIRVDTDLHTAAEVGDEPLLLARAAPTYVAKDRPAGIPIAYGAGADVIVMDDGFQNPTTPKDASIVVIDAAYGVANGLCVPAGPLRAPIEGQMRYADALVVVGEGDAADRVIRIAARRGLPVFRARLKPRNPDLFAGLPVLCFAGIARPQKVVDTLIGAEARVDETRFFPDHHAYQPHEASRLIDLAERNGLTPVTTEKDLVRLSSAKDGPLADLARRAMAIRVDLVFDEPRRFKVFLIDVLKRAQFRRLMGF